ncbi:MAG: hypothetical protein HOY69_34165 [Streptomyces sp.]|nr:hypothetical protein [Streptomyces sp.]
MSSPIRRGPRWLAAAISGVLVVVLATQPAAAAVTAHHRSGLPPLPQQRTRSAAGLPHRTASAVKSGPGSQSSPTAVRVPGALPAGTAPNRAGRTVRSFSGPQAQFDGRSVTPPPSVARSATTRNALAPADAGDGDPVLPGLATTGTEIVKDRTADTSVFEEPDGTLTARVYSRPVHYQTADGSWQDIDTTLIRRADGRWAENADAPAANFAATGSDPALVTVGSGDGDQVSFGLQGASAVAAEPSGSSVTYPGIAASSDLTYEATASGVKETLTLGSASAPVTWVFPLRLSGLSPRLASDGGVEFTDASGTVRETIPHGFMEDSARGSVSNEGAMSTGVTYGLTATADGAPALQVSLDSAWLHSADRVFPVKVDPTNLNVSSSTYVETPYDINFSTADTLKVGSYDGGSHKAISYLNFSSFGTQFKNDYIEKASLYVDDVWSGGCTAEPVDVRPITSSWSVGSIAKYPGLSYGSPVGTSSFYAGASCGGSAWHGVDIGDNPSAAGVKLLEGWAHGGAEHGLALTADTSKVAAWKQFASVNSSYPPYLSVTFSAYGADYSIPKQTYTEPTASTTGSMKVTVTNRGEAAWTTSTAKLAADVYSTSWTKLSTNATQTAVPSSVAANSSVTITGKIPALDPGQYYICWDMLNGSTSYYTTYAVPMVCSLVTSADTPPQVDTASPPSDAVVGTVTPQLFADGHDPDDYPGNALKYDFRVYSNPASGKPALVTDSGWIAKGQWVVPVGKLAWYANYYWIVADSDGDAASDWSDPSLFSTSVQQPLITSHLGGGAGSDSGRSFDPQVGDYTTSVTDAAVPSAGPALDVSRTYNSLDPRTSLLFGAGWSSRYDMTVQPDNDSSGGVVVTAADGRQERFGRNSFELNQIAAAGDQTGDHVDDAVAVDQTTGKLWLYPGPDYSALSRLQVGSGGWNGMSWLTGGDVNGDGVGDLDAVQNSDGTLWMYPGVAGGGYTTRVQVGSGGWNGMALLALTPPLGSDGKKDLVAAQTSDGTLWAYPVNGDGSLGTRVQIGSGGWNGMTELMGGDFNGDGHGDVVGVEKSTGYLWLYPGNGANALATRVQIGNGWNGMEDLAPVRGVPGDGTVDFLATQKSDGVRYLYHSGATFNASTSYAGSARTATGMAVYTPAAGEFETFGPVAGTNAGWALEDKSGTTYTFGRASGAVWKLTKITDRHHRTESLAYGSDGTLATVTGGSGGRALHFTWSGGHVTQVTTDPATAGGSPETWTYSYSGDDLTRVCPPTSTTACTVYSYTSGTSSGSHFRSAVLDANPSSYWRLADSSGTAAASEVAVNEGNDRGTYSSTGVTLGSAGPLPGSPTTAAAFDGAHGYVSLPNGLLTSAAYVSVGLWFKSTATTAGVLFSYQKDALSKTSTPGNYTPALYVGTSGKLYGQLVDDQAGSPIASTVSVADGKWHYAVLTGAGDSESLYLDGGLVGTKTGEISVAGQSTDAIGDGFIGGSWPDEPHASTTAITGYPAYFHGQIAEVAFYTHALGTPAVTQQYAAGHDAAHELTGVTLPSGKTRMTASYDAVRDRASQVTDAAGGTWRLGVPSTTGSGAYYRASVLSSSPQDYWRLGESSGSQAANDVTAQAAYWVKSADPGTYHDVTLGAAGPLAGSGQTAATFNGTSSYVSAPSSTEPGESNSFSIELWFKTATGGETLFGYQSSPPGATPVAATPALYVGADGHLYGQIYDGYVSPMESEARVDDNVWHQAVLTYDSGGDQTLGLDGEQTDTRSGDSLHYIGMPYVSFGAGYVPNYWPSASASNPQGYFKGSLAEISEYSSVLDGAAIADHYAARGSATGEVPVTSAVVTDPGDNPVSYRFDPGHGDRLVSGTDALGGSTYYTYDSNGFLASTTDPDGTRTGFTHNVRGDVLSRTVTDSAEDTATTSYYTYPATSTLTVTDPRNDEPTAYADPRSSGPGDTTYATTYGYSPAGDLLTTVDADGNSVISAYTTGTEAAAGGGTEPAGLVATTKDPNGNITRYGYTSAGDLAEVTAPSGLRTGYTYDGLGRRLTSTQVSDTYPGGVTTGYTYDDDNRLLTRTGPATTDAVSGATHTPQATYAYDDDGDTTGLTVADTTGGDTARTTGWAYNDHDQVASVTDPAGNTTRYGYDPFGNENEVTGPDGSHYALTYSPTGQLLTNTLTNYTGDPSDPSSPAPLVLDSRAYDPAGLLSSETDSMGRTVDFVYNRNYQPTEIWRPDFGVYPDGYTYGMDIVQYDYDAAGNVVTLWDTGDIIETDYTRDPAGRVTRETFDPDHLNTVTDLAYDHNGNVTSRTVTGGGTTEQTDQAYDTLDDVLSTTVHDGTGTLVTTHAYDQRGALTATTDPRGNVAGATPADYTTAYGTDQAGRLTQITGPTVNAESGGGAPEPTHPITLQGYDTFGEQTSLDDADGDITTYTYDADGRQSAISAPAYTAPGSSTSITPTVTALHDALGHVTDVTDGRQNTTHYTYDQLGDLTEVRRPAVDGSSPTTHTTYDTDGEPLQVTSPTGAVTAATYDDAGRTLTVSQVVRQPAQAVRTTAFEYDGAGDQTAVTLPGQERYEADYDAAGNRTSSTDPLDNTTSYAYDLDGRPTRTTLPDGTATTSTYDQAGRLTGTASLDASGATLSTESAGYDAAGNPLTVTDADRHTAHYAWDAAGHLVGQTEPVTDTSSITTSFGYDAAGHATRWTDGNRNATVTTYNVLGLPESTIEPGTASFPGAGDRTTTVAYDAAGEPATTTRPGGVVLTDTYDADGRLTAQSGTGAEAATAARSFGYDADGRLTSAGAPGGTDTYTYDDLGQLLTAAGPSGTAAYGYNSDGLLASRTDKAGTAAYTYDADGRPHTATDPLTGATLTDTYNAIGQLTGVSYGPDDAGRALSYDDQHRLTGDKLTAPGGATEASATYGYDDGGLITSRTTTGAAGAGSETYGYDQAGRLTSWSKGAATTAYGYDDAGNRTSVSAGGTTTTATYNARDQLTGTGTDGATSTTYTYSARGTRTAVSGPAGAEHLSSDAFDQLTSDGSASYTHDSLGRMASAGSNTFGYDGTAPGIVSDGTETYDRDPDGGLTAVSSGAGAALTYTDRHGDLIGTFTPTGTALAGSTAYDPYGATTATGGTQHDLGYQGGWTDAASGRIATASRWYDPATGNFTSHDATSQSPVPSVHANPYAYGDDDPMDNADPSGDSACRAAPYRPGGHAPAGSHRGGGGNAPGYDYPPGFPDAGEPYSTYDTYGGSEYPYTASQQYIDGLISENWGGAGWNGAGYMGLGSLAGGLGSYGLGELSLDFGFGLAFAFGYSSCNVVAAPPPPPPPTAEMGVHENPGARPVGQATGAGTHAQPGTKTAATGPGVTAPATPQGAAPATAGGYTPATMTTAPTTGGLGTTLPADPSAGLPSTTTTPIDPSAGLPNTLPTPIDPTAGLPLTLPTPAVPNPGLGSTSLPADPSASDPLVAYHSADPPRSTDIGPHVVLGINPDADALAEQIGGRTYNHPDFGWSPDPGTAPPLWQTGVLDAVSNPAKQVSVSLNGLDGRSFEEMFRLAYRSGAQTTMRKAAETGSGLGTVWEMSVVGRSAYFASVGEEGGKPWPDFHFYYRAEGETLFKRRYPDEPDWLDLRKFAGQIK